MSATLGPVEAHSVETTQTRQLIAEISAAFEIVGARSPWFRLWQDHSARYFDLEEADRLLVSRGFPQTDGHGSLLFVIQTYASSLLEAVSKRLEVVSDYQKCGPSFFTWLEESNTTSHAIVQKILDARLPSRDADQFDSFLFSEDLGKLFQSIFPSDLRHLLGEYYTPEWLIDDAVNLIDVEDFRSSTLLFDPAAGSGGFAIRMLKRLGTDPRVKELRVVLSDISPIANQFSRLNISAYNAHARSSNNTPANADILLSDTICDPIQISTEPLITLDKASVRVLGHDFSPASSRSDIAAACAEFEFSSDRESGRFADLVQRYVADQFFFLAPLGATIACGNPPWISWDGVMPAYRQRIAEQWVGSSLTTNSGWRAKVAAGKNDLSTLFVHRCAERHATPRALMLFALPISVFQGRHSGAGFRNFAAGPKRRYAPTAILDLTEAAVFADAANRPSLAAFRADQKPAYPIRYGKVVQSGAGASTGTLRCEWKRAQPIDPASEGSPIVVIEEDEASLFDAIGPSQYRARGGVNTGGANGILWVEILGEQGEDYVVRNTGKGKGTRIRTVEGVVEKAAVAPMVAGKDIKRWKASPSRNILFLYDKNDPKRAISEREISSRYPKAANYIAEFEADLRSRKEYHRWGGAGPFYELYRIGPYTFSNIKVVWQHTGFTGRLNVSVLKSPVGRIAIPDQKVIMIPFDTETEAHYVCAYLGSSIVEKILGKYLGIDASTHILDYISLLRFDPVDDVHLQLAKLSEAAHSHAARGEDFTRIEQLIDKLAEQAFFRSPISAEPLRKRLA